MDTSQSPVTGLAERPFLRRPKITEIVVERLRTQIGELPEGTSLPLLRELSASMGVGRRTVSEALGILERQGLVQHIPGSREGARVCRPNAANSPRRLGSHLDLNQVDLHDRWLARIEVEKSIVRAAALWADAGAVGNLVDAAEQLVKSEPPGDHNRSQHAADSFYSALDRSARNSTLEIVVRSLRSSCYELLVHRPAASIPSRSVIDARFRHHTRSCRKLAYLIASRRAQEAPAYWERHLRSVAQTYEIGLVW